MKNIASIRQMLTLADEICARLTEVNPSYSFMLACRMSHNVLTQISNRVYGLLMSDGGVDYEVELQDDSDVLHLIINGQSFYVYLEDFIDRSSLMLSDVVLPDIATIDAVDLVDIFPPNEHHAYSVYVLKTDLYDLQPAMKIDSSDAYGQIFTSLTNNTVTFVFLPEKTNENKRVRNKRPSRISEAEISNSRLETLSNNLLDYQSTREIRRRSTSKSDINYLENKITNYLSKINRFVDEFGLDFLKKRLKETYETEIYSTLLDEATEYLKESRVNENLNTDVSWGGLDFASLPDEDRHAMIEASKEIYRDIQLQNPVLFEADTRYLGNLIGAALAALYQYVTGTIDIYQDSRHRGRIHFEQPDNYVIEITDNSRTYEYVVPAHITRQIRG